MNAPSARRILAALAVLAAPACRGRTPPPAPHASARSSSVDAGRDSYIRRAARRAEGCPALDGARGAEGSLHGDTVAGAERWLASESPHRVPYGLHLHPGATLDVEPCALLLVGPGMEVVVHGGASMRASGTTERPIRIARLDPAQAWQALEVRADARADTSLDGVTLEGAGSPPTERASMAASLRVAMRSGLRATGLAVVDGEAWGVAIVGDGRFADHDSVVSLSRLRGEGAVTVEDVRRVADLPRFAMSGNASNDVRVEARLRVLDVDARWRSLGEGVRYRVRPHVHVVVEGASSPTLTLEAGARVSFGESAELDVGFGAPGALSAEGDALHPVVFDGDGSGRWVGIHLGPRLARERFRLAFARIEHAGEASGVVVPTCGDADAHVDEAMLTAQGVEILTSLRSVAFVDGPPEGFALVIAGDFDEFDPTAALGRGALDFTRSRVRAALGRPYVRGRCAADPRIDAGNR